MKISYDTQAIQQNRWLSYGTNCIMHRWSTEDVQAAGGLMIVFVIKPSVHTPPVSCAFSLLRSDVIISELCQCSSDPVASTLPFSIRPRHPHPSHHHHLLLHSRPTPPIPHLHSSRHPPHRLQSLHPEIPGIHGFTEQRWGMTIYINWPVASVKLPRQRSMQALQEILRVRSSPLRTYHVRTCEKWNHIWWHSKMRIKDNLSMCVDNDTLYITKHRTQRGLVKV